jgi:hypothetical protein
MIKRDNRAVSTLISVFPAQWTVEPSPYDESVEVTSQSYTWRFRPLWVGEGTTTDLDFVFLKLNQGSRLEERDQFVAVGRSFSQKTRQRLDALEINWADTAGRAHIKSEPGLLIVRDTALKNSSIQASSEMRWSPSTAAVAEVLLHDYFTRSREVPTGSDWVRQIQPGLIGEKVQWSYPQISKVLQSFDEFGYTAKRGSERGTTAERVIEDPTKLLSDWTSWFAKRDAKAVGFHSEDRNFETYVDLIRETLPKSEWAITGWAALNEIAPYTTSVPNTTVYVPSDYFAMTTALIRQKSGLHEVSQGARLLIQPGEPQVFRQSSARRMRTVSPVRLYGDLYRIGDRGEDAANHLRESTLGF